MPTSCVFIRRKNFLDGKEHVRFLSPELFSLGGGMTQLMKRQRKGTWPLQLSTLKFHSGGPVFFSEVFLTFSLLQRQSLSPGLGQRQELGWNGDENDVVISLTDYLSFLVQGCRVYIRKSHFDCRSRNILRISFISIEPDI